MIDQPAAVGLYRRVLGEAFEALPPVLRRFHEARDGTSASGVLRVTRGKGWLRGALADLGRLPPQGSGVPIRLSVLIEGERERWRREFGGVCWETVQWCDHGLLVEAAGALRLGFRLVAIPHGMRFERARGWLFFLLLPLALTPRVEGRVTERQEGWWVRVRIEAPILGLLAEYEGEVTPVWDSAERATGMVRGG